MTRCIVIVLDSVKIGVLPDSSDRADETGDDTIGTVADRAGGFTLPNFERLATGHLTTIRGVRALDGLVHSVRVRNVSKGEQTTTGHRGSADVHTDVPFATYSCGFPPKVARAVAQAPSVARAVPVACS